MGNRLHLRWLLLSVITVLSFIGCASSFQPRPLAEVHFQERAQTQVEGNVRVTASVLSADETEAVFGVALYKNGDRLQSIAVENDPILSFWWTLPLLTGQRIVRFRSGPGCGLSKSAHVDPRAQPFAAVAGADAI